MGTLLHRSNCVLYSDIIVSQQDGDDKTGDGTYTKPFKTLWAAMEVANPDGDTIILKRGEYSDDELLAPAAFNKTVNIVRDEPHSDAPETTLPKIVAGKVDRVWKSADEFIQQDSAIPRFVN